MSGTKDLVKSVSGKVRCPSGEAATVLLSTCIMHIKQHSKCLCLYPNIIVLLSALDKEASFCISSASYRDS